MALSSESPKPRWDSGIRAVLLSKILDFLDWFEQVLHWLLLRPDQKWIDREPLTLEFTIKSMTASSNIWCARECYPYAEFQVRISHGSETKAWERSSRVVIMKDRDRNWTEISSIHRNTGDKPRDPFRTIKSRMPRLREILWSQNSGAKGPMEIDHTNKFASLMAMAILAFFESS
jgi:hypothetical protein